MSSFWKYPDNSCSLRYLIHYDLKIKMYPFICHLHLKLYQHSDKACQLRKVGCDIFPPCLFRYFRTITYTLRLHLMSRICSRKQTLPPSSWPTNSDRYASGGPGGGAQCLSGFGDELENEQHSSQSDSVIKHAVCKSSNWECMSSHWYIYLRKPVFQDNCRSVCVGT